MKDTIYLRFIIFLILFVACKKEDKTEKLYCGAKDPITEISWLATEIESMKANKWATEISYCTYNNGLEGFHVMNCLDCNPAIQTYYDCEGNSLCSFDRGIIGWHCSVDSFEVITSELIWEYTPEPEP